MRCTGQGRTAVIGMRTVLLTWALSLMVLSSAAPAPQFFDDAEPPADAGPPATIKPAQPVEPVQAPGTFWMETISRVGTAAFGDPGYQVFRNVKNFGAVGDGKTDDTAAINAAISSGTRCPHGGDSSSTTSPAIVYFPAGTYKVSQPIIQAYYTQLIGDVNNPPTLLAAPSFSGMAVIDSDPYDQNGDNWYINQNNFFRQIRNFVIDLTQMPLTAGAGIHWQVAQATSLQNIKFLMHIDSSPQNRQVGIFMDNGSGGFMSDLSFVGGQYGAFFGNQQFTTRNLSFSGCQTAIYMNWNWVWAFSRLSIDSCGVGIDMTSGGLSSQNVGSVIVLDSVISNTPIGVATLYQPTQNGTSGTLVLDNVDMSRNVPTPIANFANPKTPTPLLAGSQRIAAWSQGRTYRGSNPGAASQGIVTPLTKPAGLLDSAGRVVTRSKPQYQDVNVSEFLSVKRQGHAVGDGVTDDTNAIQQILNSAQPGNVVFFDQGSYLVTKTINVPVGVRITGEIWPIILAGGSVSWQDPTNPQPVFRVGQPGDVGTVEISDLVFEVKGPQPGAVMMEWNLAGSSPAAAAMWDTHFRIGGTAGSGLQSDTCGKNPTVPTSKVTMASCAGAGLLLHLTSTASAYLENNWMWVADHDLDRLDHGQINVFNGRGLLVESTNATWIWGSSSEHSVLYNYQLNRAANVFMSLIQSETAYFQGNPDATLPYAPQTALTDPTFATPSTARTIGLRVVGSSDVFVLGAGLYSFFDNYSQTCLATENCQSDIVRLEGNNTRVNIIGLSTKASVNMVTVHGKGVALDADNRNTFCATLAGYFTST